MSKTHLRYRILILLLSLCLLPQAGATAGVARTLLQKQLDSLPLRMPRPDSLQSRVVRPDSLSTRVGLDSSAVSAALIDSAAQSTPWEDTSAVQQAIQQPTGMLQMPAFSTARDSIIEDFSNGKKMLYYYGDVQVTYGSMSLKAGYMAYDVDSKTVFASGFRDSTGKWDGKPEMQDNGKTYTMESILYNFETNKMRIWNMITQEEEGFLHGEKMKMMPDKSINIQQGKYTVCEHEHPHYYLQMTVAKTVTQPTQKTVFGPAYLVLADVPLPLGLPFGFVPKRPDRASGLLFPSYGEEVARGFYLKDLGYYFVLGDYFDIALTGDIYTKGSWAIDLNSRYKVRYKYNGSFGLTYSADVAGERGSTDFSESRNFSVKWSHAQDPKARPGTSFRASVNFSSPSNNRYNSTSINEALQSQVSSSISYSKTWSKMSMSINALHSQNSRDSSYNITLPNLTFNVNRFYPFKRQIRVGKERFYEKIALTYNTTFQNKISFKASEVNDPDFWSKMKNGMNHKFSIALPSFTLLKYLNFSPSVNYGMNWYFQESYREYNPETNRVDTKMTDAFSSFGLTQDFSAGISMSTRIYGMFNFRPDRKMQAIRHMITPSVSFSYKPEMGTPGNGFTTYTYEDKNGEIKTVEYNRYSGGVYNPPSKGKTARLSFEIGNNLEAKLKDEKDTTGVGTKKIKLIDQLTLRSDYNFLADSMNFENIGLTMNTTILSKINLSGNMNFDPYAINERGQRINEYSVVRNGLKQLVRLTRASASLSYTISGEGRMLGNDGSMDQGGNDAGMGASPRGNNAPAGRGGNARGGNRGGGASGNQQYYRVYYHPVTGEYIPGGWVYYMNPNVPWSLNMSASYSYSKTYQYSNERLIEKNAHTLTMNMAGQVRLTKDLSISANANFDVIKMQMSTSQISANYDLHCFQISFSWVPTGQWKSWSFRINAKAAALADLLQYKKNASYRDNF